MNPQDGPPAEPATRADILRILSPLLLFAAHVIYLVGWSADPFLKRWLDGSFTFFVALVLCNIVRSRIVAQSRAQGHGVDEAGPPPQDGDPGAGGPG